MRRIPGLKKRGRFYHGRWRGSDGKVHSRSFGTRLDVAMDDYADLKRQARRARLGLEDEQAQVRPLEALRLQYLAAKESAWKPEYFRAVKSALTKMLVGVRTVADLTTVAAEEARAMLSGSNRTRNKKVEWLIGFARWIRRTGRGRPPLEAVVPLPRKPMKVRRALTRKEAAALQKALDGGPVGNLVAVLLGTGFRLEEALRLEWKHLLPAGLHVERSKNGDARVVPIGEELRARLAGLRTVPQTERILLSPRGRPMDGKRKSKELLIWFRRGILAAEISPVGLDLHALRHTYATWAANAGATALQLMALMGWRSVSMAERYVHREQIDVSQVVMRMGHGGDNGLVAAQESA